jgi:hypothetical protein
MPSGKYLDILLRCLQLLTLCSISFQAWAILYEHIRKFAEVSCLKKIFHKNGPFVSLCGQVFPIF